MLETLSFKVEGLDCAEEVSILKKVVGSSPGIIDLGFNVLQSKMSVSYDSSQIDSGKIIALVASTGMKARPWNGPFTEETHSFWKKHNRVLFTALSGVFLCLAFLIHLLWPDLDQLSKSFYLAAIVYGVVLVVPKAFFSLRHLRADINVLMLAAVFGAVAIGEWFEGASVAFLFSVALQLEQWSVRHAQQTITSLMQITPPLARVIDLKTGNLIEMPVEDVSIGQWILIRPGEKIPLDGLVRKGSSAVNESTLTGESIPLAKEIGDEVFAGTLNEDGALECEVTKLSEQTTVARMIRLVEEARSKRSKSEQWVETFAKYYTPFMLLAAVAIMLVPPLFFGEGWTTWIYRGLVLLIIGCPCALVISTPVSIVSALTAAARRGILIKGGIHLEMMGKIKALALDKTGTLTYGHPEVQKIVPLHSHTHKELLEKAAALEKQSHHPLARAILKRAEEEGISYGWAENFQAIKGKGAQAIYKGQLFWIGSHRFMHENGQETDEIHNQALELEDAGHSIVAIGNAHHVCGLISIADSPRPWIRETIEAIRERGVKEIVMLTGDNEPTASALAAHCGIHSFQAELLPEDKMEAVLKLKEKWGSVAMVGDGINDAPAIAAASVGIAMAGMGTDAAIETADIALITDDLSKVPWLIRHSRRTLKIIQQNIGFSLGIKGLFILLAAFNLTTLWMAIAADTGATLIVVFNALRLLRTLKN